MKTTIHGGSETMRALTKALGLPPNTRAFVLRAGVDQVTTIECEYHPTVDSIKTAELPQLDQFSPTPRE